MWLNLNSNLNLNPAMTRNVRPWLAMARKFLAMAGHGTQFSAMAGHGSQFLTVAGHGPQFPAMAHHTYLASHEPDPTPEDDDAILTRQSKHTYPVPKDVHCTYMLLTYWLMWDRKSHTSEKSVSSICYRNFVDMLP